jgi:hypothetical protein
MQQVHNDNVLVQWCKERGYMLKHRHQQTRVSEPAPQAPGGDADANPKDDEVKSKPKAIEETHLFLNGGRARIPDEAHEEFLHKMAEAYVRQQAWIYVVEKKTNPGRMFLEMDLVLWDRQLSSAEVLEHITKPFSKVMRAAYPGKDIRAVVCTAAPSVVGTVSFSHMPYFCIHKFLLGRR